MKDDKKSTMLSVARDQIEMAKDNLKTAESLSSDDPEAIKTRRKLMRLYLIEWLLYNIGKSG